MLSCLSSKSKLLKAHNHSKTLLFTQWHALPGEFLAHQRLLATGIDGPYPAYPKISVPSKNIGTYSSLCLPYLQITIL